MEIGEKVVTEDINSPNDKRIFLFLENNSSTQTPN